jgi:hypothetical protein
VRFRAKVAVHRTDESVAATDELQNLLSHSGPLPDVWLTAVQSVCGQAGSIEVSLLAAAPHELPVISHRLPSAGLDGDVVVIPERGAALLLANGRGALLLRPQAGLGAITAARQMLLQFGDQLGAALADADQKRSSA